MRPAARAVLALGIFVGCAPQGESEAPVAKAASVAPTETDDATAEVSVHDAPEAGPEQPDPIVLIDDPQTLDSLGLGFGPTVMGVDATDTLALRKSRRFRELASRIREFDMPGWWLRSSRTELQLSAVVNRLDRQDMLPGTCGETRLVYRVVHHTKSGETKTLPAALNVLFVQHDPGQGCQSVAQSWRVEDAAALAKDGGPLSEAALSFDNVRAVESNVQGDFRGRPRNVLKIHLAAEDPRWDRASWKTGVLEFSPDTMYKGRGWERVTELISQPAMREAIAQGTATTQDRGIRYPEWDETGHDGFGRAASLLPEDGDYAPFEDKAAFLNRARSLTCGGCHDTRAVEGFHVANGASAHLVDETAWRRAYVTAVAQGREPNRVRLSVYGED